MVRTPPTPPPRLRHSRRSSFARRDSNLALLGAVLTGAVLAFALLLLLVQPVNPGFGTSLRGATADGLAPLIAIARAPADMVQGAGRLVGEHMQVVARNRELQQQLQAASKRAAASGRLADENARLERLLRLRRPERRLVASAMASQVAANGGERTAILSAGQRDGIRPRMPVLAADGLAGRVTDVGRIASRMLLITDGSSRVPVRVQRTGWTGLAIGNGGTLLEFSFDIASGTDRLRVGDQLLTSGDGGLFPPGIPVAVIVDTEQTPPLARPLANPAGLGVVTIEAPWLSTPDFLDLPPAGDEADLPAAAAPPVPPALPATAATPAPATVSRP